MVSSLLAGIHAPLVNGREGLMPESLTRRANAADVNGGCPASFRNGVRLHFGIMSGFASERCPASPGTASGIASEYPSGFNRISQVVASPRRLGVRGGHARWRDTRGREPVALCQAHRISLQPI